MSEHRTPENPSKWRFTWEAQSHSPILRLFLFNRNINPSTHFINLKFKLMVEQSLLTVSWVENGKDETSLMVPVPRVLIDVESPLQFKALDDHIEVKLVLLLPVDSPIFSNLDSVMNLSEFNAQEIFSDYSQPLSVDSDVKNLSSSKGVHFYCRNCSTKLTTFLRFFEEMPSVNWREVADNWFGACCCSFGGISEKLVTSYAKSYKFPAGVCLLSMTSVILCMEDLLGCKSYDWNVSKNKSKHFSAGDNFISNGILENGIEHRGIVFCENQSNKMQDLDGKVGCMCPGEDKLLTRVEPEAVEKVISDGSLSCMFPKLNICKSEAPLPEYCDDMQKTQSCRTECCMADVLVNPLKDQQPGRNIELLEDQKIFLNGYLADGFMSRSSHLSKNVQWIEFSCPECSCLLGTYPSIDGHAPVDGRVRLFKCYVSTHIPVGDPTDLFRKYTLERMFTNQLLESAKDEISFRTVVRDLQTKSPLLQLVLLIPNMWCCSGYCCHTIQEVSKINMCPTIKLLFSDCRISSGSQLRLVEEWVTKNQADEVYMFESQIKELIECLGSLSNVFPKSHKFLQDFFLSSMRR